MPGGQQNRQSRKDGHGYARPVPYYLCLVVCLSAINCVPACKNRIFCFALFGRCVAEFPIDRCTHVGAHSQGTTGWWSIWARHEDGPPPLAAIVEWCQPDDARHERTRTHPHHTLGVDKAYAYCVCCCCCCCSWQLFLPISGRRAESEFQEMCAIHADELRGYARAYCYHRCVFFDDIVHALGEDRRK